MWYFHIGEDKLSGPVTGTTVLPVDPMTAFGSDGAAKVPLMIGGNRDEFTLFVALQYLQRGKRFPVRGVSRLAVRDVRDRRRRGGRALPAGALRRQCGAGVFVGGDGRRVRLRCRSHDRRTRCQPTPSTPMSSTTPAPPTPDPLRTLPFPIGASHSLELRYLFDIGGAPPLDSAQQACRPDDRLLEQFRHDWRA